MHSVFPAAGKFAGTPRESPMPAQEYDRDMPRTTLRPNRNDPLHDLLQDVDAINERAVHALGSLTAGGLPAQKRHV